jgi:quinol monooxygenase YgiN
MTMPVMRVSRGRFDAPCYAEVRKRLHDSQRSLVPAVRALRGCLHYWAAIDPVTNSMVNVSVWESLDAARQMDTLVPMLTLAADFTALGVTFERPIVNYETLWQI